MDHQTLEELQIPERYLLGQLPAEQAERFEQHTLYCPQCQERLEAIEGLLEGLRTVAAEDAAVIGRLGIFAWLGRRSRATLWAAAAALLLLAAIPGLILWRQSGALDSLLAAAGGPRPAAVLSLATLRSATLEPSHQVALGDATGAVVLSLELDEVTAERYAVTLSDEEGRELWQLRDLAPDHRDSLPLTFPAAALAPGVYRLWVEALPADAAGEAVRVGHYAFRAVD